ncbi:hypothetical protein ABXJ76_07840 [Methylobacter sp. G7]|uniref:hypothetical protein n=1 Tax=Methylobacter sp. G7 TaxID=3230117 RepID=UPI003D80162F
MINVELEGMDELHRRLSAIDSPQTRNKIIKKIGAEVRKNSKKRAITQTNLTGTTFAKHARGRKRKMLTRLAQRMVIKDVSDDGVTVGWGNSFEGGIADQHHFGTTRTFTRRSFGENSMENVNKNDQCTRRQAKALIEAGFKRRRAGRPGVTPTIRWLVENMTVGQAGVILRALRGGPKESWMITLPARQFLGVSETERAEITTLALGIIQAALERQS